jgi:uncharacterized membrane-anchored protein
MIPMIMNREAFYLLSLLVSFALGAAVGILSMIRKRRS